MYTASIFLFRRDLRLFDNSGLRLALQRSSTVWPIFCFDPQQVEDHPYRSLPALRFMLESLADLQLQLVEAGGRLLLLRGQPQELLPELLQQSRAQAVFVNRDFTPFSQQRDTQLQKVVKQQGAAWHSVDDLLLHPPENTRKADGNPYTVFTPFYRNAARLTVPLPEPLPKAQWGTSVLPLESDRGQDLMSFQMEARHSETPTGGRSAALAILAKASRFTDYGEKRDFPAIAQGTTRLSAHHKFGTVSVREVFHHLLPTLGSSDHPLLRQLYWRDFFTQIAFHFPKVFGNAFQSNYNDLPWSTNEQRFAAWCEGRTGFPIVDAGMRELNNTGYMHNRARMIVASFLTKDLHIDWRWGERYFAQRLVDYDPCVNNGSWQWAASTGCDAQPYFRIFNPWLQQKRFDVQCEYIHRWIPELRGVSPTRLHRLDKEADTLGIQGYPAPMVEHSQVSQQAKELFAQHARR
ncbi:MAG: deoxyribodipyrimidine photo-lyase [Deltaproteobacteria bacterium]